MNTFKMAWTLLKNNFKLYKFYLVVLTMTVAIYYNFLAIHYNPYLDVLNEQYDYARTASSVCSCVLVITVVFFMIHANNFFYKQRFKEIGIYLLMGIKNSKIGCIFAIESVMVGCIALSVGIGIGVIFSKLFFMLLTRAMILKAQIPFYIPIKAIRTLILIFGIILIMLAIKNYRMVKKGKLIDMLNATKKEQELPSFKWQRGILGITCIGIGYGLAWNIERANSFFGDVSIPILILVCIGTYLFFGSFMGIILDRCVKNKNLIYKGSRIISFSNTLFRLGSHYRSYAMTAILCAATVTAFGGSLALRQYADQNVVVEAPYSISYIGNDNATNQSIISTINASSHKIILMHRTHMLKQQVVPQKNTTYIEGVQIVTSYSEVLNVLQKLGFAKYEKILENIKPNIKEVIKIPHAMGSSVRHEKNIYTIGDKTYILKQQVKMPFTGEIPGIGLCPVYILSDEAYENLKVGKEEIILNGINITNPEDSMGLVLKLAGIVPGGTNNLNTFVGQYEYKYYLVGAFYFLGLVMTIVFVIATFSTIYFKILSDAIYDKNQYGMLIKIGTSKEELVKSIRMQVGMAFILPAILGISHGSVAVSILEAFMQCSFKKSIFLAVVAFAGIMGVFYIIITKKYIQVISEGEKL
ncbi:MAG: FtsX-like permease family protein [Cellulosilyticaceae bacterium]